MHLAKPLIVIFRRLLRVVQQLLSRRDLPAVDHGPLHRANRIVIQPSASIARRYQMIIIIEVNMYRPGKG